MGEVKNLPENSSNATPEDEMTMEQLLEESSMELQKLEQGTTIKGTIVSKSPNELLVNVRSKYEGIVRAKDLDRVDPEYLEQIQVGDEIPVYVVRLLDDEGYVILSLSKAVVEKDWIKAKELFESGEVLEREVISTNKGGVIVAFGSVRGFVPGSQLTNAHSGSGDKNNRWANLVGEKLQLKIIEVDQRRNRLILSERAAMDIVRRQQKAELLENLKVGEVIKDARVTGLAEFGAFIDLGSAEGLVHLSELSWSQVSHPREVLKVGDIVDVYVLNIDHARQRIGLSLKRLQPEPWSQALEKYQPGEIVHATITKVTNFGAFARIDNMLEGLIHISELADYQVGHPHEVVHEGDEVDVRIISIEPSRRRMGLSLKQAQEPGFDDAEEAEEETAAAAETEEVVATDDTATDSAAPVEEESELQEA